MVEYISVTNDIRKKTNPTRNCK